MLLSVNSYQENQEGPEGTIKINQLSALRDEIISLDARRDRGLSYQEAKEAYR